MALYLFCLLLSAGCLRTGLWKILKIKVPHLLDFSFLFYFHLWLQQFFLYDNNDIYFQEINFFIVDVFIFIIIAIYSNEVILIKTC